MSRRLSSVLDITLGTKKSWTVLVQVLEDVYVQRSRSGHDFKKLVLTDSKGTLLNALIYENHLRFFACLLVQYKKYYISNAVVSPTDSRYRISTYEYSWVLNNRTLVEEFVETIPMTLSIQFDFTNFCDLHKYADSEYSLNVKAVVLHCFPSREQGPENSTRRDIVTVNEEKKLLLLTLWNRYNNKEGETLTNLIESGPVIFGLRLKVTTFNSLSLTTRTSSGLLINPPGIETLNMKDWYNENKQEIQELFRKKSYKNTDLLLPYPKEEDIIPVSKVASSLNPPKTAWIKGKTSLHMQERSFWFTACANCQKSLEADLSWVVMCPSCRVESEVEAMSKITILIDDGTASIRATICTPEAEKLMPFTGLQLKEADENSLDLHEDIAEAVRQHSIVAFVRSYETTFHNEVQMNMSVVKCYKSVPTPDLICLPATDEASESTFDVAASGRGKEHVSSPSTALNPAKRSLPFSKEDSRSKTQSTFLAIKKEVGVRAEATRENPIKKTKGSST